MASLSYVVVSILGIPGLRGFGTGLCSSVGLGFSVSCDATRTVSFTAAFCDLSPEFRRSVHASCGATSRPEGPPLDEEDVAADAAEVLVMNIHPAALPPKER